MDFLVLKPKICPRVIDPEIVAEGIGKGYSPFITRILAGRPLPKGASLEAIISPKLKELSNPFQMADMEKAANRLALAIEQGECIGIETDHDCDGQTSHAVLYDNLVRHFKHPKEKIRSYIGHRLTEGYGLSDFVAKRILNDVPKPSLIITADNGSSDEPRIFELRSAGIDVIVTDHHEIPMEGFPKSAYACLNPTRPDCLYPDHYIAGCMVAWLLMTATRQRLIERGLIPTETPKLLDTLDFVAVGTIADCVSMARSQNNRSVVSYGLRLVQSAGRPCWQAIKQSGRLITGSEDIAFRIAPLLNSDGRLDSAFKSVSFLLSETEEEALQWITVLTAQNEARKIIQKKIVQQGTEEAFRLTQKNYLSCTIFLEEGHSGVHGIAASRIKDMFGRPTVFLAPKFHEKSLISGSVRGIEKFHVRQALQFIHNKNPNLFIAFGGHKGAGGVTFHRNDLDTFQKLFELATGDQISEKDVGPCLLTDGLLAMADLDESLVKEIVNLEPFGREFEYPLFETEALILNLQFVGDKTHAKVLLEESCGKKIKAIWFSCRTSSEEVISVNVGDKAKIAYSVKFNTFGFETFEFHIRAVNRL